MSAESDERNDGLLSLGDVILLFIYRKGRYERTKSKLADELGHEANWVGRNFGDLETRGLIRLLSNATGYEVTQKGKVRLRPFIVPKLLLAFAFW